MFSKKSKLFVYILLLLIILSTLIAIVDIILIVSVKKGVEKWTI